MKGYTTTGVLLREPFFCSIEKSAQSFLYRRFWKGERNDCKWRKNSLDAGIDSG